MAASEIIITVQGKPRRFPRGDGGDNQLRRAMVARTLRSDLGRPDSITVTDRRTVVEQDALPKPSQLRGLVKGMTAGEKAEDYLRKVRGDVPGLPHHASLF